MCKRICFILFIFFQLGCQTSNNSLEELKTQEYSIYYPSSMELINNPEDKIEFVLLTKQVSDDDNFIENINLVMSRNINYNFENYIDNAILKIKEHSSIIQSEIIKKDNLEIHRMIFEELDTDIKLTFIQHSLIFKNKLYVLTFSAKSDDYENYYDTMNKVLLSFKPL